MNTLTTAEARRALSDMTLMDDAYFTKYFDGSTECASLMLSVLLGRKDLKVTKATTQKWIEGGDKRSVRLDIFARSADGRIFDVEIQRAKKGAGRKRARFYSAMLDADYLDKGGKFKELPESYVIFITERDAIGEGKAVYDIECVIKGSGKSFRDGTHILYISADLTDRDTDLGKLMHDLRCPDPERMHHRALRERARYLKRSEEGIGEMTGEFDRILKAKVKEAVKDAVKETRESSLKEGRKEMARSLLAEGSFSVSKIAKLSKLPVGEVERIKNGIKV